VASAFEDPICKGVSTQRENAANTFIIDRTCDEDMMQVGLRLAPIGRAPQPKAPRALGDRPFNPCPVCITLVERIRGLRLAHGLHGFVLGLGA